MTYSVKEIIDIAVGIEETGYEFYKACEAKFGQHELKDLFSFLASQELEHKETFKTMAAEQKDATGMFNQEYFLYMKSIGGKRVFGAEPPAEDPVEGIDTPLQAIRHAFNDERESILFYSEMKKLYSDDDPVQAILDKIIEEERQHVLTLMDLMEKEQLSGE